MKKLLVLSLLALSACHGGYYHDHPVHDVKPGKGPKHHCPPGHAKKGWC